MRKQLNRKGKTTRKSKLKSQNAKLKDNLIAQFIRNHLTGVYADFIKSILKF